MDDDSLRDACVNLENAFTFPEHENTDGNKIPEHKDINGEEFFY
jgi:hypothetical protein